MAETTRETVTACLAVPMPIPMSATDSPNTMMTSAPCRSVKWSGRMANRPRTGNSSGDIHWTASAAAHSP